MAAMGYPPATCPARSATCTPLLGFLYIVVSAINGARREELRRQQREAAPQHDFDVVIIGGGSAGCVLAARLSELPDLRVLLLERGASEPQLARVPGFIAPNMRSSMAQQLVAVAEPQNCNGTGCLVQVPQVLGGGSTINGMMYVRGNKQDYDSWGEGWSFREVLPYFKRSENNLDPVISSDSEYHGTGGPQMVSWQKYQHPTLQDIMTSLGDLGLDKKDINGPSQFGYALVQTTSAYGERWSTNRGFLEPVRHRPNLRVETLATVQRILFDDQSPPRATGVEYKDASGSTRVALARREVVLTAGALHSPQVLLRSGVGPASHLQEAGIPVVADVAGVGEGLMDHPTSHGFEFICPEPRCCGGLPSRQEDLLEYEAARAGPLTAVGPLQVTAFHRTEQGEGPVPDLQSIFVAAYSLQNGTRCTQLDLWRFNRIIYSPVVLHPESRGSVRLNTSAPGAEPLVRFGYLTAERDVRTIIEGLRLGLRLAESLERRGTGLQLDRTSRPGCQHLRFGTDEYFECLARTYTTTLWHFAGSCRMGPDSDAGAVTDLRLRVRRVRGVRVGDTSVMPALTSGNTNAPVIMIAERLADFIKEDLSEADPSR